MDTGSELLPLRQSQIGGGIVPIAIEHALDDRFVGQYDVVLAQGNVKCLDPQWQGRRQCTVEIEQDRAIAQGTQVSFEKSGGRRSANAWNASAASAVFNRAPKTSPSLFIVA